MNKRSTDKMSYRLTCLFENRIHRCGGNESLVVADNGLMIMDYLLVLYFCVNTSRSFVRIFCHTVEEQQVLWLCRDARIGRVSASLSWLRMSYYTQCSYFYDLKESRTQRKGQKRAPK